ncbi:GNAT family N-acetyltransferase [Flavobacteriaceae bacterium]|nr:GNAT family N-acetyltransferase [Flavobacteriaceae bacterium]
MKITPLDSKIMLENSRVLLLPFESERKSELKKIIFNHDIWRYMGMNIETESDFKQYVHETLELKKKGACYPFIIVDKKTNEVAGSTRFGNINQKSEKCEIGWTWYGSQFQGTGLNKATKYELLNFGFETLGFRRIQLSADLENIRSQKAIEKLGAQREGVFRNNYIDSNGVSKDDVYYSIIKEEWPQLKSTLFSEFS